jgi:hypothetical protein
MTIYCLERPKGKRQVGAAIFGGNEGRMQQLCAVSIPGNLVPRMLVYPRSRISPQFGKGSCWSY